MKVVCVGRNYAEHAKELNNPIPSEPLLFIKPETSVVALAPGFYVPKNRGECHHEAEIALLIGKKLTQANEAQAWSAVSGVGVALDLTLRDLQNQLKAQGAPWEKAKAFDGACPVSDFIPQGQITHPENLTIELLVNGQLRQRGHVNQMLVSPSKLLAIISQYFTLEPGDIVLTGTPAGVAALQEGDQLLIQLDQGDETILSINTQVMGH